MTALKTTNVSAFLDLKPPNVRSERRAKRVRSSAELDGLRSPRRSCSVRSYKIPDRLNEFGPTIRSTRSSVRGTIDDDQLHIWPQFLQIVKIAERPIETADDSESRHSHG
jgi:hypothetical protein